MDMGIFGAVALGPVIGGAFASLGDWRLLFWIAAGVGALAFAMILLTFVDQPPADRSLEYDYASLTLASVGCGAAFFGASELVDHSFTSGIVLIPMLAGVVMLIGLLAHQAFVSDPIMPIRQLGTTVGIAAIVLAMTAGGGSVALTGFVQLTSATHHLSSALFWPEFVGAILTALLCGAVFFTRFVPVLAGAGLLVLAGTGLLLLGATHGDSTLVALGTGGLGLGVGASVAPALFVAGFSLPARQLPRIFAIVELLRGVAAFLTAPILIHLAQTTGSSLPDGVKTATWVAFGLLALGIVVVGCLVASGGMRRLQTPRIESWLGRQGSAIDSTPLFAGSRRRPRGPVDGTPVPTTDEA
jgi:hypothetical protein